MSLFDNFYIEPSQEGSGLRALDNVMIQAAQAVGDKAFSTEKSIDASLRVLSAVRQRIVGGWDSPFSREQSGMILDVIEASHVAFANIRLLSKPFWFRLLEGRIEKATQGSAAFDLFSTVDCMIGDEPVPVPTRVKTEFHPGLVAIIKEKSGLSVNKELNGNVILQGLEVKAGVIDSDYRQEWKVVLRRPIQEPDLFTWVSQMITGNPPNPQKFCVKKGDKIAQVVLVQLPEIEFSGDGLTFKDQVRDGGFGSTGK